MHEGVAPQHRALRALPAAEDWQAVEGLAGSAQLRRDPKLAKHGKEQSHALDLLLLVEDPRVPRPPEERVQTELVAEPLVLALRQQGEGRELPRELHGPDPADVSPGGACSRVAALQDRDVADAAPHLDQDSYERSLSQLGSIEYQQLRHGDWTVRPEGGLFRREWFEASSIDRAELPEELELCRYWDLAATEAAAGSDPDFTAGVLLGRSDQGLWYVLEVRRLRGSPLEVERLVGSVAERDASWARESGRQVPAIRMEQEPGSAGVAVVDHYRQKVLAPYDFAGVRSTGSKQTRARPVAARCEAGDVWICRGSWNTEFLDELAAFPMSGHDDQVDALAGAYEHLAQAVAPYPKNMVIPDMSEPSQFTGEGWDDGWRRID